MQMGLARFSSVFENFDIKVARRQLRHMLVKLFKLIMESERGVVTRGRKQMSGRCNLLSQEVPIRSNDQILFGNI